MDPIRPPHLGANQPRQHRLNPCDAKWPEKLRDDVASCFSTAPDVAPLIDACSRLISSGQTDSDQLASSYAERGIHQRLKQPDLALADYDAALKILPNNAVILTNRASLYLNRAGYDTALADLNRALELFPPALSARARFYRGVVYFRLKNYTLALTDLNEAQHIEPNVADTYLVRGEIEHIQHDDDAALHDYDDFNRLAPKDPRGFIDRGRALEASAHADEALQAYEKAVSIAPANMQALSARDRLRSVLNNGEH